MRPPSPLTTTRPRNKLPGNPGRPRLTAQKDQVDLASRELDVLQREYQLRAAAMYADAGNRMRNRSAVG